MSWRALLVGQLTMTGNILLGLIVGDVILRFGLAEKLLKKLLPYLRRIGIGPILGMALTVSLGSSKAGAALLAAALEEEKISRDAALWGTLSLSFPAYLRRWPSTMLMAVGMAGTAGGIFALILLLRSLGRFVFVIFKSRHGEQENAEALSPAGRTQRMGSMYKRLFRTLPIAWTFFAAAFILMPRLETLLRENLGGSFLPLAGWGVASAAIASVAASLAMAGGSLAAGDLTIAQTVFALLLGNGLGYATRAMRQNAGYFFGLFPGGLAKSILLWSMATMLPFVLLSLFFAALPLLV